MRFYSRKVREKNFFSKLKSYVSFDDLFNDGIPIKYMPIVLFILALGIIYIFNSYNSVRLIQKENILNEELLTLRTEYMVLKSDYDTLQLQSNIIVNNSKNECKKVNVPPKILNLENEK